MLIVYDKSTGDVLDNTGTNSRWPGGPPDERVWDNIDRRGIDRDTVALLRLHDADDADLVGQVLANRHHVDTSTGQVVIDGPYPDPEPDPEQVAADTLHDRARAALDTNAAWLGRSSAPTNAQTLAHLDRLTKQVNALIRLEVRALDDSSDTAQ